ncbi:DedA family protein [Scopulibacillus cellulosilyticus]|uniref:DedA family protein n=1 Tax=Scopulibacillus cellulosilyticus TaxID=2665665 RepID=A0ABW2PRM2_9BACL
MNFVMDYMHQYGYVVLFVSLMLELLALPLPTEVLMSYSGVLISEGHLNWIMTIITAGLGGSAGMTLSYWIGYKLGTPFFEKYGYRIHIGPERLEKMSKWFRRSGNKVIIIAYFIPGVRHFTGYFSGITKIPFRVYAPYAYIGAFIWTGMFISIGKVIGPSWDLYYNSAKKYLVIICVIAALAAVIFFLYRKYKQTIISSGLTVANKLINFFHKRGRAGLYITICLVIKLAVKLKRLFI